MLLVAKALFRHVLSVGVACVGIGFALHGGDARALVVNVGGSDYDVTTVAGKYSDLQATLSTQPWFGNATLAQTFANTVFDGLGSGDGPVFAYGVFTQVFNPIISLDFAQGYFYDAAFTNTYYVEAYVEDAYTYAKAQLQPPVSSVPGPLPLFGAMAGFGMSRRLRARIKAASPKRVVL